MSNDLFQRLEELSRRLREVERRPVPKSGLTFEAPTGLTSTSQTDTTISLSWNAPVTNETVVNYNIYRNGLIAGSSVVRSFTDIGLDPGTAYTYRVSAISDQNLEGDLSEGLVVSTSGTAADREAPSTPQNFVGTAGTSSVSLSWAASIDNVGVTGYTIYRNGVPIVSTASTSYIDTNVEPGISYTYTVDAFDAAGNHSGQSNPVSVTVPQPPASTTWYVSNAGSASGSGALDDPWSLDHALNGGGGGLVLPGHTIYILGATTGLNYNITAPQIVTGLAGTSSARITVRPYPGHRISFRNTGGTFGTLFSSFILRTVSYVDFRHLEWSMYNYSRSPQVVAGGAMYLIEEDELYTQSNIRFLDCQLHDSAGKALYSGESSNNIEYNGCYFFYNGSSTSADHTAFIFGAANSNKIFRSCVFINSAAGAVQSFAQAGETLENLNFVDNVFAALGSLYTNPDRGIFLSGSTTETVRNCVVNNNLYYQPTTIVIDPDTQGLKLGSAASAVPASGQFTIVSNGDDGRWGTDGNFLNSSNLGTVGLASGGIDYHVFYRFQNINIPQGATITSASLTVQFNNAGTTDTLDLIIRGDDSDNATAPTTALEANGKVKTTAYTDWDFTSWLADTNYQSPSLTAIVQEIVSRGLWVSGNALQLFLMENGGSTNDAWPYMLEHLTGPAAILNIAWETGGGGGTSATWGPTEVITGSDDGKWNAIGTFGNSDSLTQVGLSGGEQWSSFFRFQNVVVPQGATITSAYFECNIANSEAADTVNLLVKADKSSVNPTAPTTAADAGGRARTTAQTSWQIVNWTAGVFISPNLAEVIQEIVSQGTWASGNAMVLFLDENSDTSSDDIWIASIIHATLQASRLTITYSSGSTGTPVENVTSQGNYIVRGQLDLSDTNYTNVDFSSNVIYFPNSHVGNTQSRFPSNTWNSTEPSTGATKFVKVYDWDSKRANVIIFNWGQSSTVSLTATDLANLALEAGEPYELRNSERYYSDVITGIYNGTSISVPMTGRTQATPVGVALPPTLFPRFGIFQLIINGGSGTAPAEEDNVAPSVPTGLSATAVSQSQINLSWTASTDNIAVAGYRIYRGGVEIGTTSNTSYSNTGLTAGTTYTYTVSAYDGAGNESAQSGSAQATTDSPAPPPAGDAWYVSPSGSTSNTGSISSPWPFHYAFQGAGGQIQAGDTVYLRGGTYSYSTYYVTSLDGAANNPIVFRAYPGEIPIIRNSYNNSQWRFDGANWLSFYDIRFDGYSYTRTAQTAEGVNDMAAIWFNTSSTTYIKFYGCHFRNHMTMGVRAYISGDGVEFNGCFFIFNGSNDRYDHGVYTRGILNDMKLFRDCVFAHNSGHGIHCWGYSTTSGYDQDDIHFIGCTAFQNGSLYNRRSRNGLIGGSTSGTYSSGVVQYCDFYTNLGGSTLENIRVSYGAAVDTFLFDNNIMGGAYMGIDAPSVSGTFSNNKIYGTSSNTGQVNTVLDSGSNNVRATSLPTSGLDKRLRTFNWDSRRAKWSIFNWASASTITITNSEIVNSGLTLVSGETYELHNAENYFGDVIIGTYNGVSISVPMTGRTVETPYGGLSTPPTAFPKFGCFIVITKP